ncbi:MAG: ATP-binding protein [Parcubacteria group bacterium]
MKISAKIFIVIGLGSALILVVVGFQSYNYNRDVLEKNTISDYERDAVGDMEALDQVLSEQYRNIKLTATRIKVRTFLSGQNSEEDRTVLGKGLNDNMAIYSGLNIIDILDTAGKIVASSSGERIGGTVSDKGEIFGNLFERTLSGQNGYSDVVLSHNSSNRMEIYFMSPVFSQDGQEIIGVAAGSVDWGASMKSLDNINGSVVRLYNKTGELIGSKDWRDEMAFSLEDRDKSVLGEALKDDPRSGVMADILNNSEALTSIAKERGVEDYAGNDWVLVAQIPSTVAFSGAVKSAIFLLVLLVPVIIILGIIIAVIIDRFIGMPLEFLTKKVQGVREENLTEIIPILSHDEFGELANAFNEMRMRLRESHNHLEEEVRHKTAELYAALAQSEKKNENLENSKKAMLNILEDFEESKKLLEKEKTMYAAERDRSEGILRYLHSIGEGVIATDVNGVITFVNLTAARMIARAEGSPLIGKKYLKEFVFSSGRGSSKKTLDPVAEALKISSVFPLPPYCYLATSVGNIPISGSFAPIIKNEKPLGVVSVFQDITERYNLEKEKDDFLSITAHQLRTPLTGIRWTLESLIDGDAGKLPSEATEMLDQIFKNNQRLVTLVNDLLDVSRINMGKSKEELETVDVSNLIVESIKTLEGLAKEKKVKVIFEKKCKEDPQIRIGPKHFFQAMENLISNAIKYTPVGGEAHLSVSMKKQKIIIVVADNGIGIPEKEQKNIFRKFFRASNAVLKETEGSGLGLNVVKSFVEEGGGRIWFESKEGNGTTFFIEFPVAHALNFLIS